MTPPISYEDSKDYIKRIKFDYVEIYSMMRGESFEKDQEALENEYDRLYNSSKSKTLTDSEQFRLAALNELLNKTQYLVNSQGVFHSSGVLTCSFKSNDPEVAEIIDALRIPVTQRSEWMCARQYRDAIVFYDKSGRIVSALNVCLSCLYMETEPGKYINADNVAYQKLRAFFIRVGHDVEPD